MISPVISKWCFPLGLDYTQESLKIVQKCYHLFFVFLKSGSNFLLSNSGYYFLTVPVVGRSMSPQFNPQFADYGDTVLYFPRLQKSQQLKRGKVYIFNDPTKAWVRKVRVLKWNYCTFSGRELTPGETEYVIKRCIAVEGEVLWLSPLVSA